MAGFDWDQFPDAKPAAQNKSFNWDDFETVAEAPKVTQGESLARGAAQGASLGFADEVSGGVEALWEKAKGNPLEFGKLYQIYRDESRENFKKAQDANPGTYMAGEIGAGVSTMLIPGVAAAKGAKAASVAARAAGFGGAAGAGYSEADNIVDLAKDTAKGVAIGTATSLAAPLIGKTAAWAGNKAKGSAERFAARAVGAERGTLKKLTQQEIQDLGRQAIDDGIISPLASTDDMIARNEGIKKASMNARKQAYDQIDEAGKSTFNPLEVASKVEKKVLDGKNRSHLDTQELIKKLDPELDNILSRGEGNISMAEAQQLVESLGKKAKFDASRSTESNDLAKTVYQTVRNAINESAEKGSESINLGSVVKKANKAFSTAKNTEKLLANKSAREQGNKLIGLTDWGLLGGSAPLAISTGGATVVPTAAALAAKKGLERYGSQNAAIILDKTSKVLSKSPQAAEAVRRNPVLLDQIGGQPLQKEVFPKLKVADSDDEPTKGPKKWIKDGVKNLMESDSSLSPEIIERIKADPRGKELLYQASELKPGSKAMENIKKRIRTGFLNKGDQ